MQIGRLWVRGTQIMALINLLLPRQLESGFGWAYTFLSIFFLKNIFEFFWG